MMSLINTISSLLPTQFEDMDAKQCSLYVGGMSVLGLTVASVYLLTKLRSAYLRKEESSHSVNEPDAMAPSSNPNHGIPDSFFTERRVEEIPLQIKGDELIREPGFGDRRVRILRTFHIENEEEIGTYTIFDEGGKLRWRWASSLTHRIIDKKMPEGFLSEENLDRVYPIPNLSTYFPIFECKGKWHLKDIDVTFIRCKCPDDPNEEARAFDGRKIWDIYFRSVDIHIQRDVSTNNTGGRRERWSISVMDYLNDKNRDDPSYTVNDFVMNRGIFETNSSICLESIFDIIGIETSIPEHSRREPTVGDILFWGQNFRPLIPTREIYYGVDEIVDSPRFDLGIEAKRHLKEINVRKLTNGAHEQQYWIENPFRVFIRCAYKQSTLCDSYVSHSAWNVCLLLYGGSSSSEISEGSKECHAQICIEGIDQYGYFWSIWDFNGDGERSFVNNIKKRDYSKPPRFKKGSRVYKRKRADVERMIEAMKSDQAKDAHLPNLNISTALRILRFLSSSETCFVWAKKKLKMLNIQLSTNLVTRPLAAIIDSPKFYTTPELRPIEGEEYLV